MMKLRDFPEVEEMHSVAGDTCVIMKVRTASAHAFEQFLSQLYVLPGVRATKSYVVLDLCGASCSGTGHGGMAEDTHTRNRPGSIPAKSFGAPILRSNMP